ncbi:MAG: hypothetical protein ACREOI_29620 [bacterium]
MRTFVTFDKKGNILSTCRLAFVPEEIEKPYLKLTEGESVMEIEPAGEFAELSCAEIHEHYKIDLKKKTLIRKKEKPQ